MSIGDSGKFLRGTGKGINLQLTAWFSNNAKYDFLVLDWSNAICKFGFDRGNGGYWGPVFEDFLERYCNGF